jgi:hypothetical protein
MQKKKAILEAEAEAEAELQRIQEEQGSLYEVEDIDINQILAELEAEVDNENVGIAST